MVRFASNSASKVRKKIERRVADFFNRDVLAERRVIFVPLEDIAEVADARSCEGLDWTCRDRVDANVLLAKIFCKVTNRSFERCLCNAHDVVVRHHALCTIVGESEAGTTVGHELFSAVHNGGEGIDRDVHGHCKVFAARIDITAAQFVLVREANGVNDEVQLAPLLFEFGEQRIDAIHIANITRKHSVAAELSGERLNSFQECITLIRERKFRSIVCKCFGDTPSNGFVICKTHNQAALSLHQIR